MGVSVQQIVDAQVHIGTLKNEAHPKTRNYWLDVVNNIVVIDPEVIARQLDAAKEKIEKAKKEGKSVLVVCEKKMYAEELQKIAEKAKVAYLNHKVPAGFLTNFETLQKRIASMNDMQEFLASEEFAKLTKKEQLVYQRKLARIEKVYKGSKNLDARPDLVIVVDGARMTNFINEIQKQGTQTIIISSSDFKKRWSEDSFVIANMNSYKSIDFVLNYLLS